MADINIGPTKAEDSPHASGDQGVMALGVRNDAGAALAADGDYIPLSTDSTGALRTTSTGGSSGTEYDEDTPHVSGDKVTMAGVVQQTADAALSSDGDRSLLQVDDSGFLKVNIKAGGGSSVAVTSVVPGTGATNLGKAEDGPHTSGDVGVMALAVRSDAGAAFAADGDYVPLSVDANGALRTSGAGATTQYAEDSAHVSGDQVTMAGVVQQAADAALSSDGDRSALQVDATGFAKVNVKTSALPTGAATLAEQQTQSASLSVLDDWDETDRAKVNPIVGQAGVAAANGVVSSNTQRVVLATDGVVPLPTGAATAANQTTEIASLQEIDNIVHAAGEALVEFAAIGGQLDDVGTVTPAEGQTGALRITSARGLHINLRTAAGTELGTAGAPIRTDPTGTTTQPISAASLPLPAGASTLAEQQTQTASLSVIDDWDESDRAKVNPIAGQAGVQGGSGTVTALTQRVVLATDVGLPAGTNLIGDVDVAPRTTGGWLVGNFTSGDTYTALTNSAQVIKGSAGKFGGYYIYNPNNTAIYVLVYDIAAASVTVGTSTAKLVFCIPAASAANLELLAGIPFATAMSIAATTTGDGNTAPTVALEAMVFYK